jgi:hypothetical protein
MPTSPSTCMQGQPGDSTSTPRHAASAGVHSADAQAALPAAISGAAPPWVEPMQPSPVTSTTQTPTHAPGSQVRCQPSSKATRQKGPLRSPRCMQGGSSHRLSLGGQTC